MRVMVVKAYKDKHDKTSHRPGEVLTISNERYEEINSTALGIFVNEITEGKTENDPNVKKPVEGKEADKKSKAVKSGANQKKAIQGKK